MIGGLRGRRPNHGLSRGPSPEGDDAPIVVLDLGSSRALAMAARRDGEGIEPLGFAEVPCRGLRRGVVADLEEAGRGADTALRELGAKLGIDTGAVVLAVSGAHLAGETVRGDRAIVPRGRTITHADVAAAVENSKCAPLPPDREIVQALPCEFRVDGGPPLHRPQGLTGGALEAVTYLVTGASAELQNLESALARHGRRVDGLVLAGLASGIAVLDAEEIESGAAVVDIGAGTTDLAVFAGGALVYAASLPVGAGLVTSDIGKLLKTSPEEAERLKLDGGAAWAQDVDDAEEVSVRQIGVPETRPMSRRVLAEIIESRMEELAVMVRQHLERSGYATLLPGGVALTGGGSRLPSVSRLFEQVLGESSVRLAAPSLDGEAPRPECAVSVGLAQFALHNRETRPRPDPLHRVRSLLAIRRSP